jgi:hypothetical protein
MAVHPRTIHNVRCLIISLLRGEFLEKDLKNSIMIWREKVRIELKG